MIDATEILDDSRTDLTCESLACECSSESLRTRRSGVRISPGARIYQGLFRGHGSGIARHYTTVPIRKKGSVISDTGTHFEHVLARDIQAERYQMLLSPLIVPQIEGRVESGQR
jgi:hypothetical protein